MATIEQICNSNKIILFDGELGSDQLPERSVYFTKEFCEWLDREAQYLKSGRGVQITPYEQILNVFNRMVSGAKMVGEYTKPMPQNKHIWSIHTTDIRIFGWFVKPKLFIACYGAEKGKIIDKLDPTISTKKLIKKTVSYRNKLNLEEPKYTTKGVGHVL